MQPFVFAGTPAFAECILERLLAAGRRPLAVYTQPDRSHGRGRRLRAGPVKTLALANNLTVLQPATLRDAAAQAELAELAPDLLIVAAYGLLLPPAVLHLPRADGRGAVNVHASLLPRWRGAAPVERALMAGDARTGVCLMQMEASLDTGPVFASEAVEISGEHTGATLERALAETGAELLIRHFDALLAGTLIPAPQAADGVTYARKLTAADSVADFRKPAARLAREVRALCERKPLGGELDGETVRLVEAREASGPDAAAAHTDTQPGTIVDVSRRAVTIHCGDASALVVTRVQLTRGKGTVQPVAAVLNGYPELLRPGRRFSLPDNT